MIKQVEEFSPELHSRRFRNRKLLHSRKIELIQIVAPQNIASRIPIREISRNRERVFRACKLRHTTGVRRRIIPAADISLA